MSRWSQILLRLMPEKAVPMSFHRRFLADSLHKSAKGPRLALGLFALLPTTGTACASENLEAQQRSQQIIYGADDRRDAYEFSSDSGTLKTSRAVAALMTRDKIVQRSDGGVEILGVPLHEALNVCPDERFSEQPSVAHCSATLVASDLVLTAGHCVTGSSCTQTRIVFGFEQASEDTLAPLTDEDVYACEEVLLRRFEGSDDFAWLRLDRPVVGRVPAALKTGRIPLMPGSEVWIAGHPSGLPLKIAQNAQVEDARQEERDFFSARLDSFPGNSGGGVFEADTNVIAGVLVRGPNPGYVRATDEACWRPERAGEEVSASVESVYVHRAIDAFCEEHEQPTVCHCGNGACESELSESSLTCPSDCGSVCGDGECNGDEDAGNCYEDCGACGNDVCEQDEIAHRSCAIDCECPPGLEVLNAQCVPALGNVNGNGEIDSVDVEDLAAALSTSPSSLNQRTADVNCDGQLDETDIALLNSRVEGSDALFPCHAWSLVETGSRHTCGVNGAGQVWCWGDNGSLQLGGSERTGSGRDRPISTAMALPIPGRVVDLALGSEHTCALTDSGEVYCWGRNYAEASAPFEPELVDLGKPAVSIEAGSEHTCAILESGKVRCWGSNTWGQLGTGQSGQPSTGMLLGRALSFIEPVAQLALGFDHSCALLEGGNVHCWGSNLFGQLGRGFPFGGGPSESAEAAPAIDLGGAAKSITAHASSTCAERTDGTVLCWGENLSGHIGSLQHPIIGDDETPKQAGPLPLAPGLVALRLGLGRACSLHDSGDVRCWGNNFQGELGYGHRRPWLPGQTPALQPPVPVGGKLRAMSLGSRHFCGITSESHLICFGDGTAGQLGYGNRLSIGAEQTPAERGPVPFPAAESVAWWFEHTGPEIWVREEGSDEKSNALATFVRNNAPEPLDDWRLVYRFSTEEGPEQQVAFQDHYTPWTTPLLRQHTEHQHSLVLVGQRSIPTFGESSWGRNGGEKFRLHLKNWSSVWAHGNDLSEFDRRGSREWHLATHVSLVDSENRVRYGWTRTTH